VVEQESWISEIMQLPNYAISKFSTHEGRLDQNEVKVVAIGGTTA